MSEHVSSRLSAFLDRELTEAEASGVRQHLALCEACAARLREMEGVDRAFAEVPADAPPGYFDSFATRVRRRIEAASETVRPATGPSAARIRLPAWSWAVAAAILLGILLPRLPWDGGRPRSRAEREDPTAGPLATQAPAPEPYAAEPASPAPPAKAERGDLKLRPSSETALSGPAVAPNRAAGADDAMARDAFAQTGPEGKTATPAVVARPSEAAPSRLKRATPAPGAPGVISLADAEKSRIAPSVPPKPQAKKDSAGEVAGRTNSEATAAPKAEAQLWLREEGAQDAPAAEERSGVAGLEKSEADAVPAKAPTAVAPGAVALRRAQQDERRGAPGAMGAAGKEAPAKGSPAQAEAEFEALATRPLGSLQELRLLRGEWHSFLTRHPEASRADEARVAVIAVSVEIAVRSRAEADEAYARRQAQLYLARKDATQKGRVQDLLALLGGSR